MQSFIKLYFIPLVMINEVMNNEYNGHSGKSPAAPSYLLTIGRLRYLLNNSQEFKKVENLDEIKDEVQKNGQAYVNVISPSNPVLVYSILLSYSNKSSKSNPKVSKMEVKDSKVYFIDDTIYKNTEELPISVSKAAKNTNPINIAKKNIINGNVYLSNQNFENYVVNKK